MQLKGLGDFKSDISSNLEFYECGAKRPLRNTVSRGVRQTLKGLITLSLEKKQPPPSSLSHTHLTSYQDKTFASFYNPLKNILKI